MLTRRTATNTLRRATHQMVSPFLVSKRFFPHFSLKIPKRQNAPKTASGRKLPIISRHKILYQVPLGMLLLGLFLGFMALRRPSPLKAPPIQNSNATSNSLFFAQNQTYSVKLGERNTNRPVIEYSLPQGNKITFAYLDTQGKLSSPTNKDNTVTFTEVSPNIDIKYTTLASGLKEEIILKKQAFNHTFKFSLNTANAFPESQTTTLFSGVFRNEKGQPLFHFEKPFAVDAQGHRSDNVSVQIEKNPKNNTYLLYLSLDRKWLESSDRVYPITIDPTIIIDTDLEFSTGQFNRSTNTSPGDPGSVPSIESRFQELPADQYTVGLWHMNEASGNILDSSGNSNTGTVTGATVVTGLLSNARSFNGSSNYINLGTGASLQFTGNSTIEAWIKMNSGWSAKGTVFRKNGDLGSTYEWGLNLDLSSTGVPEFSLVHTDGGQHGHTCTGPSALSTNTWHHLSAVWNSPNMTIYVDGAAVSNCNIGTGTLRTGTTIPSSIGAVNLTGTIADYFNGVIDEVRVSNIARSSEEIALDASRRPYALYDSEVLDLTNVFSWNPLQWTASGLATGDGETATSSATANLIAQWNFNETSGTTAVSGGTCGTSCNGTLTNFANTSAQDITPTSTPSGWTNLNRRWGTGALMFDGIDDFVSVADNNNLDLTSSVTLEAWIKVNNVTNGFQSIIGKRDATLTEANYVLRLYLDELQFYYYANSSWQITTTTNLNLNPGQWYHVVAANNNSSVKIYVNGQLIPTSCTLGTCNVSMVADNNTLGIGRSGANTSEPFSGIIDSPKIYSRALTASEVLANYNTSHLEFQTRVGDTTTPNDGTWEAWRTITGETQIQSFNADASNWAWDNTSTYMPQTKTDDTATFIEGTGSLKLTAGSKQSDSNALGLWHLDETSSTTAYDSSSNSNNGTLNGTTTVNGVVNKGRYFDGTDDYITLPSGFSSFTTGFTIELWAKPTAASNYARFIDLGNTSGTGTYNIIFYRNGTTNDLRLYVGNGSTATYIIVPNGIINNEWHHYAATLDSYGYVYIYRDGIMIYYGTSVIPANTSRTYNYIGKSNWASDSYYTGYMDEVTIANINRSQEEIAEDYRAGRDHHLNRTITSTDLSSVTKLPFYIASDRLGTFSQLTVGESAYANYEPDANTVALWHFDEDKLWDGETSLGGNSLVGLWHMNESSGTTLTDSSGNGYTGTTTGTTVTTGFHNSARSFNGSSDYATLGTVNPFTSNFTIEAWVYFDTVNKGTDNVILAHGTNSNNNGLHCVERSGKAYFGFFNNDITGVATLTAGRWYHMAFVYDGGKKIYIDGILDNSGTSNVYASTATNTRIGNNPWSTGNYMDGQIDELRIYNRALSANEIYLSYAATSSYIKDSSGNSNSARPFGDLGFTQGILGKATSFDGYYDYITVPSTAGLRPTNNFTIDAWVNFTDFSDTRTIVHHDDNGGGDDGYILRGDTDGRVSFSPLNASGYTAQTVVSTSILKTNTWYHIAGVYRNSVAEIYVNGKLENTKTGSGNVVYALTTSLHIGRRGGTAYPNTAFMKGLIDALRISNTARSADDIRQTYEAGARTHNITIDFKASLNSGDLIADSSDLNFTVDETTFGGSSKANHLFQGDKIIVKENIGNTIYIAQGTVNSVTPSNGVTSVTAWDSGSTFPSGGYTTNAILFKWQREYFDITNPLTAHKNAVTYLTYRLTGDPQGATIWLDDLRSSTGYLSDYTSSSIGSSTGKRYFQYRALLSQNTLPTLSAALNTVSLSYVPNEAPNLPTLDSPTDTAISQALLPTLKTTATDNNSDTLQYKITLCTDSAMTLNCQTFDQTSSAIGWSASSYASGIQASYTLQTALSYSTTYYWKSEAIDPSGLNQWGPTQTTPYSFTTNQKPNLPTLDSPVDTATSQSILPTLRTTAIDPDGDSILYKITLCTDLAMGTDCQTFDQTSSTTGWSAASYASGVQGAYTLSYALAANTTYYWKSQAIDTSNSNTWSNTQTTPYSFTTNQPPATASLDSPTDTATGVPALATLKTTSIDPESDTLKYRVLICTDSAMTLNCQTFDQNIYTTGWSATSYASGVQASYTLQTALSANTVYYWKSQAIDKTGSNTWSSVQTTPYSFTTSQAPNTPSLDSPSNSTTGVTITNISFKTTATDTNSDYLRYKITLCTDLAMTLNCQTFNQTTSQTGWSGQNTQSNTAYTSGTQATYTFTGTLSTGTTYYWQSQAIDPAGSNSWGSVQVTPYSFTTDSAPNIPTIDSPTNGATDVTLKPDIKTTTTDNEGSYLRYKIQICTNSSMTLNCKTFDQTSSQTGWSGQNTQSNTAYTSGTQATYTLQTNLSPSTTYYVKTSAIDPAGTNVWGSSQTTPSSFTSFSTPDSPSPCNVIKATDNTSITVNWTDNATNENNYQVWRVVDGGLPAQLGSNLAANTIQLVDTSVSLNHSYGYLIRALRYDGANTVYSNWCSTASIFLSAGSLYMEGINLD